MIELSDLQKKLENEGTLNHKLSLDEFKLWIDKRSKSIRIGTAFSVYNTILQNGDMLQRIHLELEYGCFTKDSEMGHELYGTPSISRAKGRRSNKLNRLCKRLQQSYSTINKDSYSITQLSAEEVLTLYSKRSVAEIAKMYRVSKPIVYKWLERARSDLASICASNSRAPVELETILAEQNQN